MNRQSQNQTTLWAARSNAATFRFGFRESNERIIGVSNMIMMAGHLTMSIQAAINDHARLRLYGIV